MQARFRIIATVFEPSIDRAIDVIRALPQGVDGVELRVDRLELCPSRADFEAVRNVTAQELIMTRRTTADYGVDVEQEISNAMGCGFEWLDVEYSPGHVPSLLDRYRDRAILSFHDFIDTPDVESLFDEMHALDCAHVKIAVTPRTFSDSRRLLQLCTNHAEAHLTVIGMGGLGLYTRILAPFFGSDMIFAASSRRSIAAPGQLTLDEALEIFGTRRSCPEPLALFAVVGMPASHSRSPMIHNRKFFENEICAAYSIIDTADFREVADSFATGETFAPTGLSVTAPHKKVAMDFAREIGAEITPRAESVGVVNTLVRIPEGEGAAFLADNSDVEGFRKSFELSGVKSGSRVALVGAGSTARAAASAAVDAGLSVTIFNRTRSKADALAEEFGCDSAALEDLDGFSGGLVINTVSSRAELAPPDGLFGSNMSLIDVGYGFERPFLSAAKAAGANVVDGLQFLEAQAESQAALFSEAVRRASAVA